MNTKIIKLQIAFLLLFSLALHLSGQIKDYKYIIGDETTRMSELTGIASDIVDTARNSAFQQVYADDSTESFNDLYKKYLFDYADEKQKRIINQILEASQDYAEKMVTSPEAIRATAMLKAQTDRFMQELYPEYREIQRLILVNFSAEDLVEVDSLRLLFQKSMERTKRSRERAKRMVDYKSEVAKEQMEIWSNWLENKNAYTLASEYKKGLIWGETPSRARLEKLIEKYDDVFTRFDERMIALRKRYTTIGIEVRKEYIGSIDAEREKEILAGGDYPTTYDEKYYLLVLPER